MSCSKSPLLALLLLGGALSAAADTPVVIGLAAEADDTGNQAFSFAVDVGLGENTWLSGTLARAESDRSVPYADLGLDHYFGALGVRLAAGSWGDDELLSSDDLRGSLYWRGERASLSLDLERRDFTLLIGESLLVDPRRFGFSADGIGLSASLPLGDDARLYFGGMDYEYSRDIRLQADSPLLRFFLRSRLSLVNSLIDHRLRAGYSVDFGLRTLDLSVSRWQTEADRSTVDSYAVGFLTPAGPQTDIEFRLSYDDSEAFGAATVFSVFLYLFAE